MQGRDINTSTWVNAQAGLGIDLIRILTMKSLLRIAIEVKIYVAKIVTVVLAFILTLLL